MALFGYIVTAADVQSVQAQLLNATNATDLAIQTCQTLDAGSRAAWGSFVIAVRDYATQAVGFFNSGQMAVQAEKLADQFCVWQKQFAGACTTPVTNTTLCGATGSSSPAGDLVTMVKYVALAAGVVAGAYAVGKVVELLPHPLIAPKRK